MVRVQTTEVINVELLKILTPSLFAFIFAYYDVSPPLKYLVTPSMLVEEVSDFVTTDDFQEFWCTTNEDIQSSESKIHFYFSRLGISRKIKYLRYYET